MSNVYQVVSINGEAPPPAVGRGNRYEIRLLENGISVSLGCSNVAVAGSVADDGLFRASDPANGGVVTGSGTCGIAVDRQLEPRLHRSLLAGEVKLTGRAGTLTLTAPSLVIEGRAR